MFLIKSTKANQMLLCVSVEGVLFCFELWHFYRRQIHSHRVRRQKGHSLRGYILMTVRLMTPVSSVGRTSRQSAVLILYIEWSNNPGQGSSEWGQCWHWGFHKMLIDLYLLWKKQTSYVHRMLMVPVGLTIPAYGTNKQSRFSQHNSPSTEKWRLLTEEEEFPCPSWIPLQYGISFFKVAASWGNLLWLFIELNTCGKLSIPRLTNCVSLQYLDLTIWVSYRISLSNFTREFREVLAYLVRVTFKQICHVNCWMLYSFMFVMYR